MWLGRLGRLPQTDGGYLGLDIAAFVSAVVSGAPGVFATMLLHDAGIETDLTITPGQTVSVSGDPSLPQAPSWGGGEITVQENGSLALVGVVVANRLTVKTGGSLALNEVTFGANGCLSPREYSGGRGQVIAPTTPPECPHSGF